MSGLLAGWGRRTARGGPCTAQRALQGAGGPELSPPCGVGDFGRRWTVQGPPQASSFGEGDPSLPPGASSVGAQRGPVRCWCHTATLGQALGRCCRGLSHHPLRGASPSLLQMTGSSPGTKSKLFLMKFPKGGGIHRPSLCFSPHLNRLSADSLQTVSIGEIHSAGCLPGHGALPEAGCKSRR